MVSLPYLVSLGFLLLPGEVSPVPASFSLFLLTALILACVDAYRRCDILGERAREVFSIEFILHFFLKPIIEGAYKWFIILSYLRGCLSESSSVIRR